MLQQGNKLKKEARLEVGLKATAFEVWCGIREEGDMGATRSLAAATNVKRRKNR